MTKQTEDTMYTIHQEVEKLGLRKEFDAQMRKMDKQDKHKWKTVCESWEYALNRIKDNGRDKK